MLIWLQALAVFFAGMARNQASMAAEIAALRLQLAILKGRQPRPKLTAADRLGWVLLRRWWSGWRRALVIVKPETVIRWHRAGWRLFWRRRSRPGRPPVSRAVQQLIRRLSLANPSWGSPRLRDELRLLGIELATSTIERYMPARGPAGRPGASQSWLTFLRNHAPQIAAVDFFTVPTLFYERLYVWVVILHGDRRLAHVAVTRHPSALWAADQLDQALAGRDDLRYLIRDNDGIYGRAFRDAVATRGLKDRPTARASPWQNGTAERVVGTLKRELTDHLIPVIVIASPPLARLERADTSARAPRRAGQHCEEVPFGIERVATKRREEAAAEERSAVLAG